MDRATSIFRLANSLTWHGLEPPPSGKDVATGTLLYCVLIEGLLKNLVDPEFAFTRNKMSKLEPKVKAFDPEIHFLVYEHDLVRVRGAVVHVGKKARITDIDVDLAYRAACACLNRYRRNVSCLT